MINTGTFLSYWLSTWTEDSQDADVRETKFQIHDYMIMPPDSHWRRLFIQSLNVKFNLSSFVSPLVMNFLLFSVLFVYD